MVIGCENCEVAQSKVWRENSHCENSKNRPGYRCKCDEGYEGNQIVTFYGTKCLIRSKSGYMKRRFKS